MKPLERIPAVRKIDTDRADLLALEIAGPMSGADVENLVGLVEAALAIRSEIDLLVRWPDGEAIDWSEVAPETLEAARAEARSHIRRVAAVGESGDISTLLHRLADTSRTEFRRFAVEEDGEAWAWIDGRTA